MSNESSSGSHTLENFLAVLTLDGVYISRRYIIHQSISLINPFFTLFFDIDFETKCVPKQEILSVNWRWRLTMVSCKMILPCCWIYSDQPCKFCEKLKFPPAKAWYRIVIPRCSEEFFFLWIHFWIQWLFCSGGWNS